MLIGVTERGDGGLDQSWREKLENNAVDGAIIITKAPQLLLDKPMPENTVIHCTITGLGGTVFEPNVEPAKETLLAWAKLLNLYGKERVVLRVDPIIPFDWMFDSACAVIENAAISHRVRISFIDMYPHVKTRFAKNKCYMPNWFSGFHAPKELRLQIWEQLGKPEVCGEPDLPCTGCVSKRDIMAMGLDIFQLMERRKDQRPACACLAEKTELLGSKKPCKNGCIYCYWKGAK